MLALAMGYCHGVAIIQNSSPAVKEYKKRFQTSPDSTAMLLAKQLFLNLVFVV